MSDKPNRYDGPCWRCGAKVPAMTGTYSQEYRRSEHAEERCKTTTKTYKDWQAAERPRAFQAADRQLFTDAGYVRVGSLRIEYPDTITGHGLSVLVGGYDRNAVFPHGVRVYRAQQFLGESPEPVADPFTPAERYYEEQLDRTRALIALIDSFKEA